MSKQRRQQDRHFATLLAEYHEALIEGRPLSLPPQVPDPLAGRLRDAQGCVARLHAMWAPNGAPAGDTLPIPDAAPDESGPTTWQGQTIGRFQIECELGHGGAGIVLLAVDPKLGRRVALKVPRPEGLMSRELRERFVREAEAAARLNHPHIVAVYEVGEVGPIVYIAAEYCSGPSLAAWLAEGHGTVPPPVAAAAVADLAAAVHHAHARGVLHRDLKPSNVLLETLPPRAADDPRARRELGDFVLKVGDFGLAKLVEREGDETRSGTVLGTPQYMAPEQAEGRVHDIGVHTDVHALGVILYELLTGVSPYSGATETDTLRRVLLAEPNPPRRMRPDVPSDLEAICLKCLEKSPLSRYASAAALADDLRRYLAGEPTLARPVNTANRLWKWARRRPAVAALSAVLAAAMLTIFAGAIVYSARLQSALTETTRQREVAQTSAHRSRQLLYAADMRRAHAAWKSNHAGQVLEILNQQIPQGDEEDLREFSWYYLCGLCDQQQITYRGHQGDVFSVACSPDGKFWASAGKDGTIRLWDTASAQSRGVIKGHTGEVTCVVIAPDGEYLASGSEDHTVRLWSLPDGAPRGVLAGHTDHVLCLAISPDGKWLASGGRDDSVRIWDAAAGEVATVLTPAQADICSISFSRRGDALVAGDLENSTFCWRTGTWEPVTGHRHEPPGSENMLALAHSPRDNWMAGGGRQNVVYLWEVGKDGLRELRRLRGGHVERIQALRFSPTGETLAAADKGGVIQLWDMQNLGQKRTILGHPDRVWSLAWSRDGRQLASAAADGTVRVWNAQSLPGGAVAYPPLRRGTRRITFTPDGRFLVASCFRVGVYWFDTLTRELVEEDSSIDDMEPKLRISPDSSLIAIRVNAGNTMLRKRGATKDRLRIPGNGVGYGPLAWSADGKWLATTAEPTTALVVEAESGKVVRRFAGQANVYDLGFSPDGRQFAIARDRLVIHKLPSMEVVANLDQAGSVCYSADSQVLATQWHSEARVYDAPTGRLLHKFPTDSEYINLTLSPDGTTLAIQVDQPARIILLDVRTGQELLTIEPPGPVVSGILFSPRGDRLVATGEDEAGKDSIWEWQGFRERH